MNTNKTYWTNTKRVIRHFVYHRSLSYSSFLTRFETICFNEIMQQEFRCCINTKTVGLGGIEHMERDVKIC